MSEYRRLGLGDTVLVQSSGTIGTVSKVNGEVAVRNGQTEHVDESDVLSVTGHLRFDRWKRFVNNTDTEEILNAWNNGVVVDPPHGLDADEVRYVDDVDLVLLRIDCELVTAISMSDCKPELWEAVNRVR